MEDFCSYAKLFYVNISHNVYRQVTNLWELVLETDHVTKIVFCLFLYAKIGFLLTATKVLIREWKERTQNSDVTYDSTECAICMDFKIKQPVRINCGHIFCYNCLVLLIKNDRSFWLKCPMCRSKICKFSAHSNSADSKKVSKLNQMLCYRSLIKHPRNMARMCVGFCVIVFIFLVQKFIEYCIKNM